MKTLKESILSRSSHSGEGFKVQRREMIEKWLYRYNINRYTINDDFTIDVDGFVVLDKENLKEFPEYIQFNIVKGDFYCSENNLTSLRGCPREVSGNFYCNKNELLSLEGAPKKVRNFDCGFNRLTSLKGAPIEVMYSFYCDHNQLTSLKGTPKKIGMHFGCNNNKLTTLEGVTKEVGGDFYWSENTTKFTETDVRKVCNVKGEIFV